MNTFSEDIRNSIYGKKLSGLLPVVQKGKTIPTFNITDEAGNKKDIYEFMNGKKYLLIDFSSSWSGPCRKEIPNL